MKNIPFGLTTWRLIRTQPRNGAWNMAMDEAILESVQARKSLATLRLFAWSPPCLSLGYAQPYSDIDPMEIESRGWDVVRRITGGRAILHTDELTYSVIGPANDPRLLGGVLESYQRLSEALLCALINLGLSAKSFLSSPNLNSNQPQEPVCFENPSNYEIIVQGKKLIGSAQARKKNAVLQHGTLPLCGDISRIIDVLGYPDDTTRDRARKRLLNRATTIESELNKEITWEQSASALIQAFSKTLNINFEESNPTHTEITRTSVLVKEKYAHPNWIKRI